MTNLTERRVDRFVVGLERAVSRLNERRKRRGKKREKKRRRKERVAKPRRRGEVSGKRGCVFGCNAENKRRDASV